MTSENNGNTSKKRQMQGKIISTGTPNGKTVVVEVERRVLHPKYKKFVRSRAKYHAHDENNDCNLNDEVIIQNLASFQEETLGCYRESRIPI